MYVADEFVLDGEIEHILRRAASIERRRPAHMEFHLDETGFSFEMATPKDPVLRGLMEDTYQAVGVRNRLDETLRFRRYRAGDGHRIHTDAYEIDGNFLIATAILYLDDADGGETWFPNADGGPVAVDARRGRLAVWFNYTASGEVDRSAHHAGLTVRSGVKTTITNFMYNEKSQRGVASQGVSEEGSARP